MSVAYGRGAARIAALTEADFSLSEGEHVALWGPSGSGKTTLLHVLGGLVTPTSGEVIWRGRPLSSLDAAARSRARSAGIAYVFQGANLLPTFTAWQKRVLNTAVRFVGFPYVWGGTSEKAEAPFGVQARGGFDCSGFVWRVYKLQTYPGGAVLNATIKGRTTYQMSGEVPRSKRITFAKLAAGDLLFFGPKGPRSKPSAIGHTGVYLGAGWMIHSSGQGVAVVPLTGWYRQSFAWGRRPLAEAGFGS